jgi:hypothetical protein
VRLEGSRFNACLKTCRHFLYDMFDRSGMRNRRLPETTQRLAALLAIGQRHWVKAWRWVILGSRQVLLQMVKRLPSRRESPNAPGFWLRAPLLELLELLELLHFLFPCPRRFLPFQPLSWPGDVPGGWDVIKGFCLSIGEENQCRSGNGN